MKGDIYHIVNRGVEKRNIFLTKFNYLRFIDNLLDFNDKNNSLMSHSDRRRLRPEHNEDDEIVDVLCVCLMPNHFHLLVQEKIDNGASLFSKKMTSGYTQYFNLRNDRSGVLFQGRTKIIPVDNESHFARLPYYIFANPIKLKKLDSVVSGVENKETLDVAMNYKWSSFIDTVLGKKGHFSGCVKSHLFYEAFDVTRREFKKSFVDWMSEY